MRGMATQNALGETIRERRKALRIGLREMASAVCVSPTHVSRVETGNHHPSEALVMLIAAFLTLDADALLALAGRVPSDVEAWLLADASRVARVRRMMAKQP